ncbi:nucleotidyltransferase domain-containing protein [Marinomonas sp. M1K-6]|jgi:predicted nucleotidyltransferase|uniref:Nucleotidyltransferase domain-containing protein n=1 Tax=Marinomonas profundi TaxID=2726122 RepID=A0A847QY66_9GAMM|nr:nucleotidyltransferase domain-containing protein [Marinomonas profundi]NLQ18998.1 nucleotidyltransferase domain-containing protein [Marinomonas profundi]UDV04171.1 nucleotidyltransferase domain-containing protein [Marinomonas profundi]
MRLTEQQQQAIIQHFTTVFRQGKLFLFGSRVDDTQKGGDIDLYIIPSSFDDLAEKKITFLTGLKRDIGDQKIDLVIHRGTPRLIDRIARESGFLLCDLH